MLWVLKYQKNWYGLPMETATAKTKETQGEYKWGIEGVQETLSTWMWIVQRQEVIWVY